MDRGKIVVGEEYLAANGTDWAKEPDRWHRVVVTDVGPFIQTYYSAAGRVTLDGGDVVKAVEFARPNDEGRQFVRGGRYGVAVRYVDLATGEPIAWPEPEVLAVVDVRRTWAEHLAKAGPEVEALLASRAAVAATRRRAVEAGLPTGTVVEMRWGSPGERLAQVKVSRSTLDALLDLAIAAGWGRR